MSQQFERPMLRRNDRCQCGSGLKYKHCHGRAASSRRKKTGYIDAGETPVRWVISDRIGTSFFSTKDNAVIVFPTRESAYAIATMDEFQDQEPGDINVGGVGPTKWVHLQEKLKFIEVADAVEAKQLIFERIHAAREQLMSDSGAASDEQPSAE